MWGAFWLQSRANTSANARMFRNPTDFAATYGAEIDIVEAVSKHRPNNARDFLDYKDRLISNVHWNGYTKGSGPEHKRAALGIDEQKKKRQSSLHNQWHTYGLLWTEGAYEIYIDNTLMGMFDKGISHHPEYLRLTTQVDGGRFAGEIPDSEYRSGRTRMQVDWVRWWQRPQ